MDHRNSSFLYPNKQALELLSKTVDDFKCNISFTKSKAQSSNILRIISTSHKITKTENAEKTILLFKTPLRLFNNGNYCYINSSIQALLPTINDELMRSLRNARDPNFPAIELFNLYLDKLESKIECWNPINNIRNLKYFSKNFRNGAQEDAQEFLNGFLDRLREEFDKIDLFKGSQNPVRKTYAPFYDCRYYCCKCKKSNINSPQIQEELTFFLEIAQDLPGMINMALKTQNNNFKCENCNTTNGSAKMDAVFTSLPKTFICCVKRFKHSFFSSSKNQRDVEFCKRIQLPYIDSQGTRRQSTYDIAAVVIHLGSSLSGGHYECVSKLDGQWHRISDSSVSKINELQAVMSTKNSSYIYIFTQTSGIGKPDLKRKLSSNSSWKSHPSVEMKKKQQQQQQQQQHHHHHHQPSHDKSFLYPTNLLKNHNAHKRHKPDYKGPKNSYGMKQIMASNRQQNSSNNFKSSSSSSSSSSSTAGNNFPGVNSSSMNCNTKSVLCQNS